MLPPTTFTCGDCLIQPGFYDAWIQARGDVLMAVSQQLALHPGFTVVTTGHSLEEPFLVTQHTRSGLPIPILKSTWYEWSGNCTSMTNIRDRQLMEPQLQAIKPGQTHSRHKMVKTGAAFECNTLETLGHSHPPSHSRPPAPNTYKRSPCTSSLFTTRHQSRLTMLRFWQIIQRFHSTVWRTRTLKVTGSISAPFLPAIIAKVPYLVGVSHMQQIGQALVVFGLTAFIRLIFGGDCYCDYLYRN
jgi:hypothetical protein